MKRIWAPWRSQYVRDARKDKVRCVFCGKANSKNLPKDLVIARGQHAYSVLNLYPYNSGHSMVVPYRHVGDPSLLTQEEWLDIWRLTNDLLRRMKKVFKPHGYNLGMNLGRPAGAGIPKHLHLHVVPRWIGDANFMPILNDTRVISQSLAQARKALAAAGASKKRR